MTHADRDRSELHAYLAADKADYPRTWKGDGYARAEAAEAKVAELTAEVERLALDVDVNRAKYQAERAKVARVEALRDWWRRNESSKTVVGITKHGCAVEIDDALAGDA